MNGLPYSSVSRPLYGAAPHADTGINATRYALTYLPARDFVCGYMLARRALPCWLAGYSAGQARWVRAGVV